VQRTRSSRSALRDPAGLRSIDEFQITPDGNACAYILSRRLDDLYLVEGLK
jgi:hypothetical protein